MSINWVQVILQALIAAVFSSVVIGWVLDTISKRRSAEITADVKHHFDQQFLRYQSMREWQERSLAELLAPVSMQLARTSRAFKRWQARNVYVETKIIQDGNKTIRDLLLTKGHLIPPDLLDDANRLIEHYDRWLEEYDRVRGDTDHSLDEPFVFVGPKGHPFPRAAEDRFRARFRQMWDDLYGSLAEQAEEVPAARSEPSLHIGRQDYQSE